MKRLFSSFNFDIFEKIKNIPSSPDLTKKSSQISKKDTLIVNNIAPNIIKKNQKSTNLSSTDSNSAKSTNEKRSKIYNNLSNILSQFLKNEELLKNAHFIPQSYPNYSRNPRGRINEKYYSTDKLPLITDPNKNELSNEKCYYYKKLSENIVSFYNDVVYKNELIFPLKRKFNSIVLKIINQLIITSLKSYNIINIVLYGSQASGLSLPESDIDLLLIYCDSNNGIEKLINELYKCLQMSQKFHSVTSLPKASSPLIKLEYQISDEDKDIIILHMDISFYNIYQNNASIYFTPSLLIVKYIQKSIEYLLQSKYIIFLLKNYLKNLVLNNYFTGGLSSFSIFLLFFSFYKYVIKILGNEIVNNFYVGQFLVQFLDFYSQFHFNQYIVNINKEIPFIIKEQFGPNKNNASNVVILDPFTLNNIAANSFRINEVQKKFDSLKINLLINYEKMFKFQNCFKIRKHKNRDKYHHKFHHYKSLSFKDFISNSDESSIHEKDYLSTKENNITYGNIDNNLTFEEYEKEMNLINKNVSLSFLDLTIK